MLLEYQNSQSGELNGPSASFICFNSDGTLPELGNAHHLSLLDWLIVMVKNL